MTYFIRKAAISDAPQACLTVRRSITELCAEDHRGDPAMLADWLANKTEANFESWIRSARHIAMVAEGASGIIGFALLSRDGQLALLYVSPDARFQGVSKAMLAALEREAISAGIRELSLNSTSTAKSFYLARGYTLAGESILGFGGTESHPMSKRILP